MQGRKCNEDALDDEMYLSDDMVEVVVECVDELDKQVGDHLFSLFIFLDL